MIAFLVRQLEKNCPVRFTDSNPRLQLGASAPFLLGEGISVPLAAFLLAARLFSGTSSTEEQYRRTQGTLLRKNDLWYSSKEIRSGS
jgi:hypothetical protein